MDHAESLLDLIEDFEIKPKLPTEDSCKVVRNILNLAFIISINK